MRCSATYSAFAISSFGWGKCLIAQFWFQDDYPPPARGRVQDRIGSQPRRHHSQIVTPGDAERSRTPPGSVSFCRRTGGGAPSALTTG